MVLLRRACLCPLPRLPLAAVLVALRPARRMPRPSCRRVRESEFFV